MEGAILKAPIGEVLGFAHSWSRWSFGIEYYFGGGRKGLPQ
jgi:hypothetical protein